VTVHGERVEGAGCAVDVGIACDVLVLVVWLVEKGMAVPAEKMEVTIKAFVRSGRTEMPMFFMAMTYGLEAPVPVSPPSSNAFRVGSLDGRMMPTHNAPMMKKSPKRKYIVLKAVFIVLRG
jgi:hypothetical protein